MTLLSGSSGNLNYLNYPQPLPTNIDFTQHVVAPLGEVITLEFYDVDLSDAPCDIEVN